MVINHLRPSWDDAPSIYRMGVLCSHRQMDGWRESNYVAYNVVEFHRHRGSQDESRMQAYKSNNDNISVDYCQLHLISGSVVWLESNTLGAKEIEWSRYKMRKQSRQEKKIRTIYSKSLPWIKSILGRFPYFSPPFGVRTLLKVVK